MKFTKLIALFALSVGAANAATITVSQGVGAQGYTVLVDGTAPTGFFWSVGSYNTISSTWTQFGTAQSDTAKVNGSVTATSPSSLNSAIIDLFVGTGNSIANSSTGGWVILRTNANTAFPSDVTGAGSVTFGASVTNGVSILAKGNSASAFATVGAAGGNLNLVTVPEASTALLGAIGALGLLRRRRN